MTVNGLSLEMMRGNSESFTVSIEERPFEEGDIVRFTVRKRENDDDVLLFKQVENFTEEGKAVVELLPRDTNRLRGGAYIYDVKVIFNDGLAKTIIKDTFTVEADVNHGYTGEHRCHRHHHC